jgi:8-oxo-dGTP diphosphatase
MKRLDVAVAIVFSDSKVLVTRRKAGGVLGGFWEFPGGKREPDESLEDCVRRELIEELAIRVRPVVSFPPIEHQYPDQRVCLYPFLCTCEPDEPQLLACDEIRWVEPAELLKLTFPPANQQLISQVIAAFPKPPAPQPRIAVAKKPTRRKASQQTVTP